MVNYFRIELETKNRRSTAHQLWQIEWRELREEWSESSGRQAGTA